MVLPVPGGPQKTSEPTRPESQHAGQRAVRSEQMVLAGDLGERSRAEPVGERPRRGLVQSRGFEEAALAHPPIMKRWRRARRD